MPAIVAEETTAEENLEASIECFLATRPVFTDEMRDRLGAALAVKPNCKESDLCSHNAS